MGMLGSNGRWHTQSSCAEKSRGLAAKSLAAGDRSLTNHALKVNDRRKGSNIRQRFRRKRSTVARCCS